MVHFLATVLLGPYLLFHGKRVRSQVPLLPEPPGDRTGSKGNGPDLNLLVLGDSAAAGVGAATQQEALLGQIVLHLSSRFTVHWRLHAVTGATTASTLAGLSELEGSGFDVIVTSLGVNDITARVSRTEWLKQQLTLRNTLSNLFRPRLIVLSGFPPVHSFRALPQPLRWYLGRRAKELDRALQHQIRSEQGVRFVAVNFAQGDHLMASDGFHPGPPAYEMWGHRVAEETQRYLNEHCTGFRANKSE